LFRVGWVCEDGSNRDWRKLLGEELHSFIYSVFQRSTEVDIELVIIITIGTLENDS
jgi:hypothetical protein